MDTSPPVDQPETCPICLSQITEPARVEDCRHDFCFVCILQWSNLSPVCPLCKGAVKRLLVPTNGSFITVDVEEKEKKVSVSSSADRRLRVPEIFRYRTTGARPRDAPRRPDWGADANRRVDPVLFRRYVYANGLRARHMGANRYSKYHDISSNNADAHIRIKPWIQRELEVLLPGHSRQAGVITSAILAVISEHDLQSDEAVEQIQPFLLDRTEHFVHELICFARSPYDIDTYDRVVQYPSPPRQLPAGWQDAVTDCEARALAGPPPNSQRRPGEADDTRRRGPTPPPCVKRRARSVLDAPDVAGTNAVADPHEAFAEERLPQRDPTRDGPNQTHRSPRRESDRVERRRSRDHGRHGSDRKRSRNTSRSRERYKNRSRSRENERERERDGHRKRRGEADRRSGSCQVVSGVREDARPPSTADAPSTGRVRAPALAPSEDTRSRARDARGATRTAARDARSLDELRAELASIDQALAEERHRERVNS